MCVCMYVPVFKTPMGVTQLPLWRLGKAPQSTYVLCTNPLCIRTLQSPLCIRVGHNSFVTPFQFGLRANLANPSFVTGEQSSFEFLEPLIVWFQLAKSKNGGLPKSAIRHSTLQHKTGVTTATPYISDSLNTIVNAFPAISKKKLKTTKRVSREILT